MKRILTFLLGIPLILCTGCTSSRPPLVVEPIEGDSGSAREVMRAEDFFFSTLVLDEEKGYIYPNTFGGMYVDGDNLIFQVAAEDFTEYQYLRDKYPYVVFQQVEYSNNYLQGLIDEYLATYDKNTEMVYMAYVDVILNRAVIRVDEETLLRKATGEKSPLVFVLGSPFTNL
ncbi:MAG: hypothetical protein J1F04_09960 [Oscillospiraceae bacterium]|nr:hypothetical protein [Oscillospiraceae bacterium]